MTESYKVFHRVAVVALAAASSITLFGCKKDEQYADADEYEKELDEWAKNLTICYEIINFATES